MYIKNDEFDTTDNDIFNIKLNYNHMYTLNSADNMPYDFVFNPLNKVSNNKINMVEVVINDKCNCDEKRIIIIDATQIVLDNSDLVIVIENNIYILDCYLLSLKKLKIFDNYPDFFKDKKRLHGIYKIWDSYVVELSISSECIPQIVKFSYEFKQEWTHYCKYGSSTPEFDGENILISDFIGMYSLNKFGQKSQYLKI